MIKFINSQSTIGFPIVIILQTRPKNVYRQEHQYESSIALPSHPSPSGTYCNAPRQTGGSKWDSGYKGRPPRPSLRAHSRLDTQSRAEADQLALSWRVREEG